MRLVYSDRDGMEVPTRGSFPEAWQREDHQSETARAVLLIDKRNTVELP